VGPVNSGERLYSTITMIIGAIISTAFILTMKNIIEMHNVAEKETKLKVEEFKAYMDDKVIPSQLKNEAKVRMINSDFRYFA
jgi:hypothetical protein